MNRTEKIQMLIGFALFVGGIAGMYACMRAADRIANRNYVYSETLRQDVWDDITSKDFYKNADSHEQTLYYDAFWNTKKK